MVERLTGMQGAALSGRDRELYVAGMFDQIAGPYDRLNRLISLGRDRSWRDLGIRMGTVGPGECVVDLGCGTGDFILSALLALKGRGRVVGIDLSSKMLEVAGRKLGPIAGEVSVDLRVGNATATGLPDASADVVTMGWVVRNLGDRLATYREILRILKPGGRFICLETSKPESGFIRAGFGAYLRVAMPMIVRLVGADREAYRYLAASTDRFLTARELSAEMQSAGFAPVSFVRLMAGTMAIHRACRARKAGS
jgi:demethylmenaquinone methyltransferase/2-methoxy-6-polyprenyl-1,4-benzoquinol methylase